MSVYGHNDRFFYITFKSSIADLSSRMLINVNSLTFANVKERLCLVSVTKRENRDLRSDSDQACQV